MGIPTGLSLTNKAWWEADTTVYSDAGIMLAVNNATVQQWNDQVSGITLSQATSGNRPQYKTAQLNGLPAISFTQATPTYLDQTSFSQAQPLTVVWVGKITSTLGYIYDATSGSTRVLGGLDVNNSSGGKVMCIYAGTNVLQTPVNYDQTGFHLLIAVFNGTSSFVANDGIPLMATLAAQTTPGAASFVSLRMGASNVAAVGATMLTCAFGVFAGAATGSDLFKLGNQLGAKYNLTSVPQASGGGILRPPSFSGGLS